MTNLRKNVQVASRARPIRERVGLGIDGSNSASAVKSIVAAEDAGVRRVWMAQNQPGQIH
jgi:hypothetical protein